MNHFRNIIIASIPWLAIALLTTCGDDVKPYTLTINGYKANFTGYYYIDGKIANHFEGVLDYTDNNGYSYYYYEVELEDFTSIKVFTFKTDSVCSLTVTLWHEDEEAASVTSGEGEYESYDEDTGTYSYVMALDPLYYLASDGDDDDDDDS